MPAALPDGVDLTPAQWARAPWRALAGPPGPMLLPGIARSVTFRALKAKAMRAGARDDAGRAAAALRECKLVRGAEVVL